MGQLGISLAVGDPRPPGFHQHRGRACQAVNLQPGDTYSPEPAGRDHVRESGLPTRMDSRTREKETEIRGVGSEIHYIFKTKRKAISCDDLLPLTKFLQERDLHVVGVLESVLGSDS